MSGRAGVFDDDLGDFLQPAPATPPEQVRGIAEKAGFRSREPAPPPGRPGRRQAGNPAISHRP